MRNKSYILDLHIVNKSVGLIALNGKPIIPIKLCILDNLKGCIELLIKERG